MIETVYTYFPGCSLATSAKESNDALVELCGSFNIKLDVLADWNCCGSSSAHCMDARLADKLAMRNLSLASPDHPLLLACPSCNLRLRHAQHKLKHDESARGRYRRWFGKPAESALEVIHFFELFDNLDWDAFNHKAARRLSGLRIAPYYGCMLARPPIMRREKNYYGIMERLLSNLGAQSVQWRYAARCCGTFLSVARPDIVTPMVNAIIEDAVLHDADCLVTACAMCHLNLEIRCTTPKPLPIFHFAELLSLALGQSDPNRFFERHLIDPRPLLRVHGLL